MSHWLTVIFCMLETAAAVMALCFPLPFLLLLPIVALVDLLSPPDGEPLKSDLPARLRTVCRIE